MGVSCYTIKKRLSPYTQDSMSRKTQVGSTKDFLDLLCGSESPSVLRESQNEVILIEKKRGGMKESEPLSVTNREREVSFVQWFR